MILLGEIAQHPLRSDARGNHAQLVAPAGDGNLLDAGDLRRDGGHQEGRRIGRGAAGDARKIDGRALKLHPHDQLLRAARAQWAADPGLREDYKRHRPNVERAIAQIATSRGRRIKLRYHGVAKNNAWLKRRTAAVNLRNLIGRGLTRQAGAWTLAAT